MNPLEAFGIVDVRAGTILTAELLTNARKPAYRLTIDFGSEVGSKQSSAQITVHYTPEQLVGAQILGVVNFPPKRIAGFTSEVLVLGLPDENGAVVLIRPGKPVPNGAKMY
ncbi:MAG: tRNA-binding protein [Vulcanimicrobiaceae bacterium]